MDFNWKCVLPSWLSCTLKHPGLKMSNCPHSAQIENIDACLVPSPRGKLGCSYPHPLYMKKKNKKVLYDQHICRNLAHVALDMIDWHWPGVQFPDNDVLVGWSDPQGQYDHYPWRGRHCLMTISWCPCLDPWSVQLTSTRTRSRDKRTLAIV